MTPPVSSSRERLRSIAVLVALAALTPVSVLLTRAVVNHDPYITYRYARNLASGAGFVYNPGEPVLSTSATLYAPILAAAARLGIEPLHTSLALGALAAFASGALLLRYGTGAARSAAFMLVTYPTSIWSPGEVIDDPRANRLPADLPPGTYHVMIGLYRLETGERLPINGSDQIKLETITIREPSQPH